MIAKRYLKGLSPVIRPLHRRLRVMHYRGGSVGCPLCERTFRTWVGNQATGSCPFCESRVRQRLLWLYLKDLLGRKSSNGNGAAMRLLHFAPEYCVSRRLRQIAHIDYLTADLHKPEAMLKLDLTRLDLPDGSFDLILCSHVLEHIPEDTKAMRELRRVIRPGGQVLLQVPQRQATPKTYEDRSIVSPQHRQKAFGKSDHVRVYGADFADRLRDARFDVSIVRPFHQVSEELRTHYGLWDDRIYCCIPC